MLKRNKEKKKTKLQNRVCGFRPGLNRVGSGMEF